MRKSVAGFAVLLAVSYSIVNGGAVAPNSASVVSYALRLNRVAL